MNNLKTYAELNHKLNKLIKQLLRSPEILEWNSDWVNAQNVQ